MNMAQTYNKHTKEKLFEPDGSLLTRLSVTYSVINCKMYLCGEAIYCCV